MISCHHVLLVILTLALPLSATAQLNVGRVLYSEGNVTIDGKPVQPGERITTDSHYLTLLGHKSMVAVVTNDGLLHVFDKGVGSIPVDRIIERVRKDQPLSTSDLPRIAIGTPECNRCRPLKLCSGDRGAILGDFVAIRWYPTDLDSPYDIVIEGISVKRDTATYESGLIAFVGDIFTGSDAIRINISQSDKYSSAVYLTRPSKSHEQMAKKYLSLFPGGSQEAIVTRMAVLELQGFEMDLLYDFYTIDININTLSPELKAYYLTLSERFDPREPPPSYQD